MNIVRIIKVTDTRDFEEVGDRWVPIPGSGVEHQCARCGRLHEVHAEVELEDGSSAVVGTGCMKQPDMAPEMRRLASRARTRAKRQAELRKLRAKLAVWDEVNALPLPPVREETRVAVRAIGRHKGERSEYRVLIMEDVEVRSGPDALPYLASLWRRNRAAERGVERADYLLREDIERIEKSLKA